VDWTEPGGLRRAALVQGNVDQATKWLPENRLPIAAHYRQLSAPHWGVDLIVWPEAALTLFEHQAAELLAALDEQGRASGTGLVLGIPALEVRPGDEIVFQNAALALGAAKGRYVKRRLVPFGEYVPLETLLRGLITFFDLPMSHAEPGAWQQPPFRLGEGSASMAICYEIVYPELSRADVNLLLTISNDTWFGHSIGPRQHLAIARMRALENGRWLLRATNNGVTAIVDPRGQVTARLPQFEAGVLTGGFRLMSGRTPFNRLGDWPLHLLLVVAAAVLLVRRARPAAGAI
jgi:apolipoprotein N-acyltransferase